MISFWLSCLASQLSYSYTLKKQSVCGSVCNVKQCHNRNRWTHRPEILQRGTY